MELTKSHFYVHVSENGRDSYDVGPFEVSGGRRFSDGAIDWIYKQIGILKSKFPESILKKHRWNYKEESSDIFGDEAVVDISVEIAGFSFEIVPLKNPHYANVIEEQIEPRPIVQKL